MSLKPETTHTTDFNTKYVIGVVNGVKSTHEEHFSKLVIDDDYGGLWGVLKELRN